MTSYGLHLYSLQQTSRIKQIKLLHPRLVFQKFGSFFNSNIFVIAKLYAVMHLLGLYVSYLDAKC